MSENKANQPLDLAHQIIYILHTFLLFEIVLGLFVSLIVVPASILALPLVFVVESVAIWAIMMSVIRTQPSDLHCFILYLAWVIAVAREILAITEGQSAAIADYLEYFYPDSHCNVSFSITRFLKSPKSSVRWLISSSLKHK